VNSVATWSKATEQEQQKALGELLVAIRRDLIENELVTETNLKPKDFQFLMAK
jgi:hypothetical protein